jgi:hypothetical protein
LLEFYESDSSVEAGEDTGDKAGDDDAGTGPDASGAVKSWRRTRSTVGKKSASAVAAAISAVKAAEQKKKKKKRRAASPPVVVTLGIPTPRSREVESEEVEEEEKEKDEVIKDFSVAEDRPARRSESPAAKRQRELILKMSEDALRRGLDGQRAAAAHRRGCPRRFILVSLSRRLGSLPL